MTGGVLVERSVGVVLPGLISSNREKMKEYTESIRCSLEAKGKELNQFRETHGIQFKADDSKEEKRSDLSQTPGDRQANILANV
ncbi:prefoldin subunit 2 [Biomphalaria glabrata]|nr:prefoldin subunit 2-like [Biomphalaria glabrata]KAI8785394.1 prefoldin subunit 2 [Biomphalaria glabrata]